MNSKRKLLIALLISFVFIISMFILNFDNVNDSWTYTISSNGYTRYNGLTYKIDESREISLLSYDFINQSGKISVNYRYLETDAYGYPLFVQENVYRTNFISAVQFTNSTHDQISNIKYSFQLFRINAQDRGLYNEAQSDLIDNSFDRYNIEFTPIFFNVNLAYYEFHNEGGHDIKLKVHVELSTRNYEDGRVYYSAAHIIKRDLDKNIISEVSYVLQEENTIQKYGRMFQQPNLEVPYIFTLTIVIIIAYHDIVNYISTNKIKLFHKEIKQ